MTDDDEAVAEPGTPSLVGTMSAVDEAVIEGAGVPIIVATSVAVLCAQASEASSGQATRMSCMLDEQYSSLTVPCECEARSD